MKHSLQRKLLERVGCGTGPLLTFIIYMLWPDVLLWSTSLVYAFQVRGVLRVWYLPRTKPTVLNHLTE